MAKKTYKIPGFPKGYHMTWYVVTQAGYMTYVRLYDKSRTYLSGKSDVPAALFWMPASFRTLSETTEETP